MSNHKHKWYQDEVIDSGTHEVYGTIYVCECGAELSSGEIVRRLNTAETGETMSKEKFNKDISQVMEQAEATLIDVARVQGSFMEALMAADFTREEAFALVQDYLRIIWGSTIIGTTLE